MKHLTGKKIYLFLAISVIIILCFGLVGFSVISHTSKAETGSEANDDDYKDANFTVIGFSQPGAESAWRVALTESVKAAFTEDKGYKLIYKDGQSKQDNQIKDIRTFIQQGVDYIILSPIVETGWDQVLEEAKEAGIPVIICDRDVTVCNESLYTAFAGSNFRREGMTAVDCVERLLKERAEAETPEGDSDVNNVDSSDGDDNTDGDPSDVDEDTDGDPSDVDEDAEITDGSDSDMNDDNGISATDDNVVADTSDAGSSDQMADSSDSDNVNSKTIDSADSKFTDTIDSDNSDNTDDDNADSDSADTQDDDTNYFNIVHIQGTIGSSAQVGRTKALEEAVAEHSDWRIIASACGEFTKGKAREEMTRILDEIKGQDIDMIYCENDEEAYGAMAALNEAGLSYGVGGKIIIVSFDGSRNALNMCMSGLINVEVECNPMQGQYLLNIINQLERGEVVPKIAYIDESYFTPGSLSQEFIDSRTY